jgi:Na+/H+ antiporter NhaC
VIKGTNISFYGTHRDYHDRDATTCKQTVPVNDSNNANREHGNSLTINVPSNQEGDNNLIIYLPPSIVIVIWVSGVIAVVLVVVGVAVAIACYINSRKLDPTRNNRTESTST